MILKPLLIKLQTKNATLKHKEFPHYYKKESSNEGTKRDKRMSKKHVAKQMYLCGWGTSSLDTWSIAVRGVFHARCTVVYFVCLHPLVSIISTLGSYSFHCCHVQKIDLWKKKIFSLTMIASLPVFTRLL